MKSEPPVFHSKDMQSIYSILPIVDFRNIILSFSQFLISYNDDDRLVQPPYTETLIFSHFTHFILRPNSDPTPSTPFELRRNSVHATSFPVTRRVPPTFPEYHRVSSHHHRDHQDHLVIIRYILTTDRQPSLSRSHSVS